MIPFLESAGGSCQLAVILIEEAAVTVKLPGDCEGAEMPMKESYIRKRLLRAHWI